ncbi:MAG: porin [Alphaproteobacteria bacterium]|nr:porin [Alphaproteobacteria bacterium]
MNKNKKLLSFLAFSSCLFSPFAAQADSSGFDFTGNAALVTEYVFRGITQSDEGPAVQGGFDASHESGLYAGVWGSSVDFNDGDEASAEVDVYAGYSGTFKGLNYDIGAIYYAYPGADSSLDYDFWEAALAVGYDFDLFSASASFNYSPNYFADSGDAQYYALGVDVPLPKDFTLSGHVGFQEIDDNGAFGVEDYIDWSVGLGYSIHGFDLSLQYIDTDLDEPSECADGCDARVVFGVSRSF